MSAKHEDQVKGDQQRTKGGGDGDAKVAKGGGDGDAKSLKGGGDGDAKGGMEEAKSLKR